MKVLKFGGSSVASAERILSVLEIVKQEIKAGPVAIVVSAFGGATDELIGMSMDASKGDQNYQLRFEAFELRHRQTLDDLIQSNERARVVEYFSNVLQELHDVLHGVFLVRECTARTLDLIMSFGERLSAFIISQAFNSRGFACEFLDARRVIRTDNHYGSAKVFFEHSNQLIVDHFRHAEGTQIITGFVASSSSGETTTLGRSGSDYTAAIVAAALGAEVLEIWTDVNGMMSADPRKVRKAFTVGEMTYQEAMELSHFGAKVVFPSTMQPAMNKSIPIRIKNTFNPAHAGTLISASANGAKLMIKGISSISGISLLNVQGSGLVGVVGVSMRLFEALAREKINVILISQASSEHSICFAIDSRVREQARESIEAEFRYEIRSGDMDRVVVADGLAIVAIVGERMKHNPGTSGRMFGALGKNGINVSAIAQGSSELNISAVIQDVDIAKALNVLHEAFFLSDRKVVNLFLAGTGWIGKSLLTMIQQHAAELALKSKLEINVAALANSRQMLFDEYGLKTPDGLDRLINEGTKMELHDYFQQMKALNLSNSIFVDCTASEEMTEHYEDALQANIAIVTPNKKANSGKLEKYKRLKELTHQRNTRFLFETNVGAGLPVINTLNDLLLSGDKVVRIEAVLSGTLNYIFSSFDANRRFSEVVKEAKEKGYTEPDPRDDLSGTDVARKILILAREAGFDIEMEDVTVQSLVPEDCRTIENVDEFMKNLPRHDAEFAEWLQKSDAVGEKLRYAAVLDHGKATVSLIQVGQAHPFYSLAGSDNIILLTTERYHERPMVIRGPGAGAEVTAAGVFADIIRLGNYIQ